MLIQFRYDLIGAFSGGGNKENPELNRGAQSLMWMMNEAKKAGLDLIDRKVPIYMHYPEVTKSLVGLWRVVEWFPLSRQSYQSGNHNALTRCANPI